MSTARNCSIAATLAVIGEKYSLLVLREVFFAVYRFDAIQRNTGAPRDVLAARLRTLVESGVLLKLRYQDRPVRFEYHLTESGLELRPVLLALMRWGDTYLTSPPPVVYRHVCGGDLEPRMICHACGTEIRDEDLVTRFADPAAAGYPVVDTARS